MYERQEFRFGFMAGEGGFAAGPERDCVRKVDAKSPVLGRAINSGSASVRSQSFYPGKESACAGHYFFCILNQY